MTSTRFTGLRAVRLAAVVLVVLAAGHAIGGPEAGEATPPTVDPVVRDVVRMLEEGVEPPVVLHWLETSGNRPGPLGADDLIALTNAAAPAELVRRLIDLSKGAAPAEPPAVGECCLIDFRVAYRAVEPLEGEQRLPSRDMFVYLDGRLLAQVESMPDIGGGGPFERRMRVDPGRHTVRLTREQHTKKKSGKQGVWWLHETRVSPDLIQFDVEAGALWSLHVSWKESEFAPDSRGPLSWQLLRDGTVVEERSQGGVAKDRWPPLCEDAEANMENAPRNPGRYAGDLDGCVRWSQLWPAGLDFPSRADVRAGLEK